MFKKKWIVKAIHKPTGLLLNEGRQELKFFRKKKAHKVKDVLNRVAWRLGLENSFYYVVVKDV